MVEWHPLKSITGVGIRDEFNPQNPQKKLGMEDIGKLCASEMGGEPSKLAGRLA